ncbi:hypothetical protein [Halorubrum sp. Hd13]|uniref:hypothetical protein n=1 Tax=Halorubrum sp. Hd13 TaxID=1480728 RepID=UPI000BC92051|nr:hypothetical protein [Halorubrum sp. Hd13]OYR42047.1 hypothetical protein DJ81_11750 [Halorubrum sp. Hd13]
MEYQTPIEYGLSRINLEMGVSDGRLTGSSFNSNRTSVSDTENATGDRSRGPIITPTQRGGTTLRPSDFISIYIEMGRKWTFSGDSRR